MRITVGDADYEVVALSVPATSASEQLITGAGFVSGFALAETAGAVAEVDLFDGSTVNGTLLIPVRLAAGGFASGGPGEPGFPVETGIFIAVTGSVKGAVCFARRITAGAKSP